MPRPAVSRLIVPVLGLGMIVSFASSYYLLGVLAEPLAAGVGTTPGVVFTALSGAFLVSAALSPFGGRWIDRRGGREALSAAAVIFALGLGLLGLAREPVAMVAGVLTLGAGMGVGLYGPAYAVLVALHGEGAKKPITAVSLLGAFGGALGWPLTLLMIQTLGWRGACFVWAGAHLALCLPLYAAVLPDGRTGGRPPSAGRVRWDGAMIRLAVLFAGAWWVATAMSAHLPRLLIRLGLSAAEAALAAGLMAGAAIAVRLIALAAPGKGSPVAAARAATLLHPLGALAAFVGGPGAAGAVALGQGAGNGLLSVASGVLPLHLFGRENYGVRQALVLTPARFLQAAAPALYGVALDRSAGLALLLSSGVCLVMFAMTFGLRRQADL
ncbi:MAG: MFS transporter [Bordetella sp.]|nr:MFS transporter [Bordetella sp.]